MKAGIRTLYADIRGGDKVKKYTELAKELEKALDERRTVSQDKMGLLAVNGKEKEWKNACEKIRTIRDRMWHIRYGGIRNENE